ncbi:MAG TPA: helix-turn-helix transcriptional regulator [Thermoanaerobaculia bacterium]|jgi:transcriptional regulator with XRE-family HTH domain|nr:helix-turn-helix transcriptional regulator [Thermoanaerobaculia bacterium]
MTEEEADALEAEVVRLTVVFLRAFRRMDQREFAKALGIDQRDVSRYETGERMPRDRTLRRMAATAGVSPARLGLLLGVFRQTVIGRRDWTEAEIAAIDQKPSKSDRIALRNLVMELTTELSEAMKAALAILFEVSGMPPPPPPAEARASAASAWQRFQEIPVEHRRYVIANGKEYQTWAFCELLCKASIEEKCGAVAALDFAELAVQVAEMPGGSPWTRWRLRSYAWGFVGSARKRLGDLPGAEDAFEQARDAWTRGDAIESEPLDENLWLALDASLRPN